MKTPKLDSSNGTGKFASVHVEVTFRSITGIPAYVIQEPLGDNQPQTNDSYRRTVFRPSIPNIPNIRVHSWFNNLSTTPSLQPQHGLSGRPPLPRKV